jgi:hypothetical protein
MSSRVRFAVILAALGPALVGCGGSDSSAKDKPVSTVSAKPATGDTVTGTGYTFTAPKGWHKPKQKIAGFDPDALVFDTKDKDGFGDNLNVVFQDAPHFKDADAFEKAAVQSLKAAHFGDVKARAQQQVDGETAIHVTSTTTQNGNKNVTNQVDIIHKNVAYVVTFSFSLAVTQARQEALIQSVMTTWKWTSRRSAGV